MSNLISPTLSHIFAFSRRALPLPGDVIARCAKLDLTDSLPSLRFKSDHGQRLQKPSEAFATKEDLKELADLDDLTKHVNELAGDVMKVHKKVEGLEEQVKGIPTRDWFPALIEKGFISTLKAGHGGMKKILREKLQVEV